jgi:hypothetical protein
MRQSIKQITITPLSSLFSASTYINSWFLIKYTKYINMIIYHYGTSHRTSSKTLNRGRLNSKQKKKGKKNRMSIVLFRISKLHSIIGWLMMIDLLFVFQHKITWISKQWKHMWYIIVLYNKYTYTRSRIWYEQCNIHMWVIQ